MIKDVFALFVIVLLFCLAGCHDKAPKGFPKTLPFTVKVTNQGKAIEGVNIRFISSSSSNWISSGATNSSGTAVIQTISGSYARKGVPSGSYKVVLDKPSDLSPENLVELGERPADRIAANAWDMKEKSLRNKTQKVIPDVYSNEKTTPVSVKIDKGVKELSIEVGVGEL